VKAINLTFELIVTDPEYFSDGKDLINSNIRLSEPPLTKADSRLTNLDGISLQI
jgi:hypothetical protein